MFSTHAPIKKKSPPIFIFLLFSASLFFLAHGLQATLIPIRASMNGLHIFAVGIIGVGLCGGYMIGALTMPRIMCQLGYMRSFFLFATLSAVTTLLYALTTNLVLWAGIRALSGFSMAGIYIILEAWVNEDDRCSQAFSFYACQIVQFLMISLSQALFSICDFSYDQFFSIASILTSLALIPILFMRLSARDACLLEAQIKLNIKDVFRIVPHGLLAVFFSGLISGQFWTFGALFVFIIGLKKAFIALFIFLSALGGAMAIFLFSRISFIRDKRIILFFEAILVLLASVTLMYESYAVHWRLICLSGLIFGAASFSLYTISMKYVEDCLKENTSPIDGLGSTLVFMYTLGGITAPFLSVCLIYPSGFEASIQFIFFVPALGALLFIFFYFYSYLHSFLVKGSKKF